MRRAAGIVAVALAGLCTVAGFVILLLPYDHATHVPGFTASVQVRCQAPLVDAVSKDDAANGWFVMDPSNTGVAFSDGIDRRGDATSTSTVTGGSLCYPDSVRRAAVGVGLITIGGTGLLAWQLVRARRKARDLDDLGDDDLEPDGGEALSPQA